MPLDSASPRPSDGELNDRVVDAALAALLVNRPRDMFRYLLQVNCRFHITSVTQVLVLPHDENDNWLVNARYSRTILMITAKFVLTTEMLLISFDCL
jgi:hypothetical protein